MQTLILQMLYTTDTVQELEREDLISDYAAVGRDAEVLEGIIEILDDEIVGDEMIQEELQLT